MVNLMTDVRAAQESRIVSNDLRIPAKIRHIAALTFGAKYVPSDTTQLTSHLQ